MDRTFELDDEVYVFNGNLYEGQIIELPSRGSLYRILFNNGEDNLHSTYFIYKKNRDEEALINEIDLNIDYLERMKKKINYNSEA